MRLTEWRRFGELFIECRLRRFGNGSVHSVGRIGSMEAFSSFKLQRPFDKILNIRIRNQLDFMQ